MTRRPRAAPQGGRGGSLPPLFHGRVRLLLLSYLMRATRPAAFTELRDTLGLTDGTLSVHLSKLEAGGVVGIQKRFVERKPQTLVTLTAAGRRQFAAYVRELREILGEL